MAATSAQGGPPSATMEATLSRAKSFMQSTDYARAIVLLQRARNLCRCISLFHEQHKSKEHSSTKACLRDSILSAALSDDDQAVYNAATSQCSCGVAKLSCDNATHMDILDKLAACSAVLGKHDGALGFATAAIHLNPKSPVGYCRLSKLIRIRSVEKETLRSDVDIEVLALAVVRHGMSNVREHGDIEHPLYRVLQAIHKKLYRQDPLRIFPPELKVMIFTYLDTIDLVRCQRVSKRWLFAIRDDPNLWMKLCFVLRDNTTGKTFERTKKSILQVMRRATKASTLSIAPASLLDGQYRLIFHHMPRLRHLHIEGLSLTSFGPLSHPPTQLTRFTCFVYTRDPNFFSGVLASSASTLEEVQVAEFPYLGGAAPTVGVVFPKLKVLRVKASSHSLNYYTTDRLHLMTPNLEQLCLDGQLQLSPPQPNPTLDVRRVMLPKLKVLVVGWEVSSNRDGGGATWAPLIPPGIRVLDIVSRSVWEMRGIYNSMQWPELEHFRCESACDPGILSRLIGPSLRNGKLKTLSVSAQSEDLRDLPYESEHVEALGLTMPFLHNAPGLRYHDAYLGWLKKFPNAHTFTIGFPFSLATEAYRMYLLASLALRPGTKTIFENSLFGVERDEFLQDAKKQDVEVVRSDGFPVIFPWRFDDADDEVVERWKNARGRVLEGSASSVSSQPFFRE